VPSANGSLGAPGHLRRQTNDRCVDSGRSTRRGQILGASQRDRDAAAFASKRAAFLGAVFVPSMSQALAPTRGEEERQMFADRLEEGVRRRIASNPASLENMVGIIVLNKKATD
jgi:hypothetical protein